MACKIKIGEFTCVCRSDWDRIAFHHECDVFYKNSTKAMGHAYCQYYNRTWERWTFQSCVLDALENANDNQRPNKWKHWEEWRNSTLKKDIDKAYELALVNLY